MSKFYLSDLSDKDKPWDKHRSETDIVASLYQDVDYERHVERLDSCSQRLLFKDHAQGIDGRVGMKDGFLGDQH